VMLVSNIACGDTYNAYNVNGGTGSSGSDGCEDLVSHIDSCNGWSQYDPEEREHFIRDCPTPEFQVDMPFYEECLYSKCEPKMTHTCVDPY